MRTIILFLSIFFALTKVDSKTNETTVKQPVESSNVCDNATIDDILWVADGKFFLFRDIYFWEYDFAKNTLDNKTKINDVWPEVDVPVRAATDYIVNGEYFIILFGNHSSWQYKVNSANSSDEYDDDGNTRAYNDDSYEDTYELFKERRYVMPTRHVSKLEAIQMLTISADGLSAYVCDEDHLLLCVVEFQDTANGEDFVLDNCAVVMPFNMYVDYENFTAFAKYDQKSFLGAGTTVMSRFNDSHLITKRNIKIDLYKCPKPLTLLQKYWKYGVAILAFVGIAYLIIIGIAYVRNRNERIEEQSVDDATHDTARGTSKVSLAPKSAIKKQAKGKAKLAVNGKGKK